MRLTLFSFKKMKKNLLFVLFLGFLQSISLAQSLSMPPDGGNKNATVSEQIGINTIQIRYCRPAVKGREGKIWGQLVPYGFNDLGFGTSKAAPWRAGANESTQISFSQDATIEGKPLKAGTYAFFVALAENGEATLIFSNNSGAWGSYFYNPADDALRVVVKTQKIDNSVEFLKYEFTDQTENAATLALVWEKLKIPFRIEVDVDKQVIESMRKELQSDKGFAWQAWQTAANYCLMRNKNLEEALIWAEYSIAGQFVGERNFQTLSTKAFILERLGKKEEYKAMIKEALEMGNVNNIHDLARSLQVQKRTDEAVEIFMFNAKKHPDHWIPKVGLVRAYSAKGNYKEALKNAEIALKIVPADNKKNLEGMIKTLKEGKDVN